MTAEHIDPEEHSPDEVTTRFWAKVTRGGVDECWLWTGAINHGGYGRFRGRDGRAVLAHRFAYEAVIGQIPDGLHIDHLCRVRACVNPSHLEAVTQTVNNKRVPPQASPFVARRNAARTHCAQGHPYDESNTGRRASGHRYCRACARERMARLYQQRRAS